MDVLHEPLTEAQVRILGVLVEKQLATPDSYPLSEKALLAGCNQTTNREPVVTFDTTVVRPALIRLRERRLTRRILRAGERAEKHAHRLDEQLQLSSPAPLAVLAVLLLRGAQTPGELRARTQRLHAIADATELEAALLELRDRGLVEALPRQPGEKQVRWRHVLGATAATGPADPGSPDAGIPEPGSQEGGGSARAVPPPAATGPDDTPTMAGLAATVRALAARVAALEEELGLRSGPTDRPG